VIRQEDAKPALRALHAALIENAATPGSPSCE
jgi:hypothetical protein